MKTIPNGKQKIKVLFTDIDDTLTVDGKILDTTYQALWKLHHKKIDIIPITGRPAGWCEMIARTWPVKAVIGENGAFYFQLKQNKMHRHYVKDPTEISQDQLRLRELAEEIFQNIRGSAYASDQFSRIFDVAIDFCEDVEALSKEDVENIKKHFEAAGAQAKVSSIHVNAWFGSHDKLSMCKTLLKQIYHVAAEDYQEHMAFIGDSPNDEPMFQYFDFSVGVANVKDFRLQHPPKYICSKRAAAGFEEFADLLLRD